MTDEVTTSDVVTRARERYQIAKDAWDPIYDLGRGDNKFLSDRPHAQWDEKLVAERTALGLTCITLDKVDQVVNQVINNIRQNTPSIQVIPDGEGTDLESATEFKGIIRGIEYSSRADSAYDTAAEHAVKARIGFIRVDNEFAYDEGFEQKLCIKRVVNPFACYIDPSSIEIDGSDAEWGFVLEKMKVGDFKKKYPKLTPIGFDADKNNTRGQLQDDDQILIAEYFEQSKEDRDVALMEDGSIRDFAEGLTYKTKRTVSKISIKRYKLSGNDELEGTKFPGRYVPIVPVYGKEAWEDGKRHLQCLISKVKPGAQHHNLWASIETDLLLKASRAPVTAPFGATENFKESYINPDKVPVLQYDQFDAEGRKLDRPQRLEPFPIPTGVVNARRESVDDVKAAMGVFNPSIGAQSNETSGIAIARRQQQGDNATFHYGDNLTKSVEHVGRILVFAAPEIYDTPRVLLSVDGAENPSMVGINGKMAPGQKKSIDLKAGRYAVRVTTGPAHATKRQEEFAALGELLRGNPEMFSAYGDLFFKAADFAGADALAERAKKMLPPGLSNDDQNPEDAEKQMLVGKLQEMQQMVEALQQQLQSKQGEAQAKAQGDIATAAINKEIKLADLEIKQLDKEMKEIDYAMKQLDLGAQLTQPQEQPVMGPTQSGGYSV